MARPGRLTDTQLDRLPAAAVPGFREACLDDVDAAVTRLVRAGVRDSARVDLLMGLLAGAGDRHPRVVSWLAVRTAAACAELAGTARGLGPAEAAALADDAAEEELTRQANYVAMAEVEALMTGGRGPRGPLWGADAADLVDDADFAELLRRAQEEAGPGGPPGGDPAP